MRITLLSLLVLFITASCGKNLPAKPAFFIQPGTISVATEPGQGSGSHHITDLWVYVNNKFQGCYPVEGKLPIVTDGDAVIQIRPGIKNNGISKTRIFWPLYDFLRIDTSVAPGSNLTRPLTFKYLAATTFTWVEDFDNGPGVTLKRSDVSDTTYRFADAADCFEGRSIVLGLGQNARVGKIETTQQYTLPRNNSNLYLELNYKCNAPFIVGVIGEDFADRDALIINPQPTWNKIYVQLASVVSAEPVSTKFRVYFRIDKIDVDYPRLFLDNIKLVYLT